MIFLVCCVKMCKSVPTMLCEVASRQDICRTAALNSLCLTCWMVGRGCLLRWFPSFRNKKIRPFFVVQFKLFVYSQILGWSTCACCVSKIIQDLAMIVMCFYHVPFLFPLNPHGHWWPPHAESHLRQLRVPHPSPDFATEHFKWRPVGSVGPLGLRGKDLRCSCHIKETTTFKTKIYMCIYIYNNHVRHVHRLYKWIDYIRCMSVLICLTSCADGCFHSNKHCRVEHGAWS
jgi:hypothetical protein